ncbi:MAG: helix-turn-helix domain-containing protein [Candidatus Cryptobacteroides sp.]
MEIKQETRTRGEAFKRILRRIVQPDRHIDEELYLFDDYSLNALLKKPFKTSYSIGIEVLEGSGEAMVNMVNYHFEAPCLVVLLSGQVIRYKATEGIRTRSRVMVMSDRFMNNLYDMSLRINDIYTTLMINPIISLDRKGMADIDLYVRSLISLTSNTDNPLRFTASKFLTLSLFYGTLTGVYSHQDYSHAGRAAGICSEFMKLLQEHFREEHTVGEYASRLCITERYLSMCVRQVTGRTAGYWIGAFLFAEAKNLLCTTDLTIARLSDSLNFPSQSSFGKFFRKQSGMSPLAYRQANS